MIIEAEYWQLLCIYVLEIRQVIDWRGKHEVSQDRNSHNIKSSVPKLVKTQTAQPDTFNTFISPFVQSYTHPAVLKALDIVETQGI